MCFKYKTCPRCGVEGPFDDLCIECSVVVYGEETTIKPEVVDIERITGPDYKKMWKLMREWALGDVDAMMESIEKENRE